MLIDHFIVRSRIRRPLPVEDGTRITDARTAVVDPWSMLTEKERATPTEDLHTPHQHRPRAAEPTVCLTGKTMDHILDWAYHGRRRTRGQWTRTSQVVDFAAASSTAELLHWPPRIRRRLAWCVTALIKAPWVDRTAMGTLPYDAERAMQSAIHPSGVPAWKEG